MFTPEMKAEFSVPLVKAGNESLSAGEVCPGSCFAEEKGPASRSLPYREVPRAGAGRAPDVVAVGWRGEPRDEAERHRRRAPGSPGGPVRGAGLR